MDWLAEHCDYLRFCLPHFVGSKLVVGGVMKILLCLLIALATNGHAATTWPVTEVDCLTANIYHEARGESIHGQWFVAYVTRNRVNSDSYPDTYCKVIKQPYQFSWWNDGQNKKITDQKSWEVARQIAVHFILDDAIAREDASLGAMYYHADYIKTPKWTNQFVYIGKVGKHLAYRRE